MKLRLSRSSQRQPEQSASYERPDDLYALFGERASDSAGDLPESEARPGDENADEARDVSRTAGHAPARKEPVGVPLLVDQSDIERRLASLTISRQLVQDADTQAVMETSSGAASVTPVPEVELQANTMPVAELPPLPLLNQAPLSTGISADTARCAMAALRAAARLAPILLLPRAQHIDARSAVRMLTRLGAPALASWVDAWSRRPVVQAFRASASRAFDSGVVQHVLADSLAVAIASDPLLARDVELLNQTLGMHAKPAQ